MREHTLDWQGTKAAAALFEAVWPTVFDEDIARAFGGTPRLRRAGSDDLIQLEATDHSFRVLFVPLPGNRQKAMLRFSETQGPEEDRVDPRLVEHVFDRAIEVVLQECADVDNTPTGDSEDEAGRQLPNIAAIRKLLLAAFTAEELRRFCQDRPSFRPILTKFGLKHGLDDMVDEVITYCEKRLLFKALLGEVKRCNPKQYERFEAQLHGQEQASSRPTPAKERSDHSSALKMWEGKRFTLGSGHQYYVHEGERHYLDPGAAEVCDGFAVPATRPAADEEDEFLQSVPIGGDYNSTIMWSVLGRGYPDREEAARAALTISRHEPGPAPLPARSALLNGITILHLSDTHRTVDEPVSNEGIAAALCADLRRQQVEEGLPKPDLLVVSGDLTQSASPQEYEEAYALLKRLKDELVVPSFDRVVLVPGNHDISWPISQRLFRRSRAKPEEVNPALLYKKGRDYYWTDEDSYTKRLDPFREFYRRIYGKPYGLLRRDQYDTWVYPDLRLCLIGLNSNDRVDHQRKLGAIYEEALFAAEERLWAEIPDDPYAYTRIAVWHHDLNWLGRPGIDDHLDPAILGHLVDASCDLALVGHAHRTDFNVYKYPGSRVPIVASGSLCAGPRQRAESIPRLYNLIQIKDSSARVHTRSRETADTPWRPYARWGTPPCAHFDVPLGRPPG